MTSCLARADLAQSRRRVAAALLFVCMLVPFAWSAEAVEVRHDLGAATVKANPKRIVAFDFSILDSIDSLGIEGLEFAIPKQTVPPYLAKFKAESVVDAGGMKEPNLEKIFEFRPDVIFISARQTDYYDKFSQIAPTIYANVDYKDFIPTFKKNMAMLGDLFDVREKADTMAGALADKAAAIAAKAQSDEKKALVVMVNDGAISVYGPGSRFGLIHDVLKVAPADPGVRVSTHGQSVDFEYLSRINPDILFVINRNAAIGNNGVSKVLDNELVQNTKAGKTGKIIHLDSSVWYLSGAGLESLPIMLKEVDAALQ